MDDLEKRLHNLWIFTKEISWSTNEKTNYIRGYMKGALKLLMQYNIPEDKDYQLIIRSFQDLFKITERNHIHTTSWLFDRRRRSELCMNALERYRETFTDEEYDLLKWLLRRIRLENWTKQLSAPYGIIRNSDLKKELYLNEITDLSKTVFEPREYIGIDPWADSDLEAPSVITAMTPPCYTQPIHSHDSTTEVTFYTGDSEAIYYDNWVERIIPVSSGDMVIIPQGITHTIRNPTLNPVKNISVKLPQALLDRCNTLSKNRASGVEVRRMFSNNNDVYSFDLTDLHLGYSIEIHRFDYEKFHYVTSRWKSLIYVLDGGFLIDFLPKDGEIQTTQNVLVPWDVAICENMRSIRLEAIQRIGSVYMVTLV